MKEMLNKAAVDYFVSGGNREEAGCWEPNKTHK